MAMSMSMPIPNGVGLMSLDYALFCCDLTLKLGGKVFMQKDTDIVEMCMCVVCPHTHIVLTLLLLTTSPSVPHSLKILNTTESSGFCFLLLLLVLVNGKEDAIVSEVRHQPS